MNVTSARVRDSLQRLGSGSRINSARDNPAGQGIVTSMQTQVRGDHQSIRNVNDAVSVLQIADGAMSQIGDSLQRLRELAVQAANATVASVGENFQSEADQLTQGISQLIQKTSFNGMLVIASEADWTFHIGYDAKNSLEVSGINLAGESMSDVAASRARSKDRAGALRILDALYSPTIKGGLAGVQTALTLAEDAAVQVTKQFGAGSRQDNAAQATLGAVSAAVGGAKNVNSLIAAGTDYINNTLPELSQTISSSWTPLAVYNGDLEGTQTINISSPRAAADKITILDSDIEIISKKRALYGAVANRLDGVVSSLLVQTENKNVAISRIADTDFASEASRLVKNRILDNSNTAIFAQANSTPKLVLSLMKAWL